MAYNNNYNNYYNVPQNNNNEWWRSTEMNLPMPPGIMPPPIDGFSTFKPVQTTAYLGQNVTTTSIAVTSNIPYIHPSSMNYGGHIMTTQPPYNPHQYIPPVGQPIYSPVLASTKALAGITYGGKIKFTDQRSNIQLPKHHNDVSEIVDSMVNLGDKLSADMSKNPNKPHHFKGERLSMMDYPSTSATFDKRSEFNHLSNVTREAKSNDNQYSSGKDNVTTSTFNFTASSKFLKKHGNIKLPENKEIYSKTIHDDVIKEGKSGATKDKSVTAKDKSGTGKDKSGMGKDKSGSSKDKSGMSKGKSGTSRDGSATSRDESGARKDRSSTHKDKSSMIKDSLSTNTDSSSSSKDKSSVIKDRSSTNKEKASKDKSQSKDSLSSKRKETKRSHPDCEKGKSLSPCKRQRIFNSQNRSPDSKVKCVVKGYENFSSRELDCAMMKNLCRTLTLPTQLFHVSLKYQQSYPLNRPMKLGKECHFKVMDKSVKHIDNGVNELLNQKMDPLDADTTFVAKVMLLSTESLVKFYESTITLAEEFDSDNKTPITKAIKFLIGSSGEDKEFGIGGAWSPSLDGPNPGTDPAVLINTAIRTCKAMTGIDLSNCSSWPKFLEVHYYRPLQKIPKKNSDGEGMAMELEKCVGEDFVEWREPRMETVVYFVPDVWNMVPGQDDWEVTRKRYQEQLDRLMCPPPDQGIPMMSKEKQLINGTRSTDAGDVKLKEEEEDYNFDDVIGLEDPRIKNSNQEMDQESTFPQEHATHFSKLNLATMKLVDIKKELELRKLNCRGLMDQLKARLKTALEKEENDEKGKESPAMIKVTSLPKKCTDSMLSSNEKSDLKKLYKLPDKPEIIVHQNRVYKHRKIRTMSLHSLLSYSNVTLKERTFEVALFAKQFLEMLRRDAVFNIYKSIVMAPEVDLVTKEESTKMTKSLVTTSKRTVNKPLLFSCSLLDRERSDKICLDSLKVLIEGLGICLSSDQLSAVLAKVKDQSRYLHYRQLTDKEMTDDEINGMMTTDVMCNGDKEDEEDVDYINELAFGNKALFEEESTTTTMICTERRDQHQQNNDEEVNRLQRELDKSERYRESLELKMAALKDETKRSVNAAKVSSDKMAKLKRNESDYRRKYQRERERGDRYKRDLERTHLQLRNVNRMTDEVNTYVSQVVTRLNKKEPEKEPEKDLEKDQKKEPEKNQENTQEKNLEKIQEKDQEKNQKKNQEKIQEKEQDKHNDKNQNKKSEGESRKRKKSTDQKKRVVRGTGSVSITTKKDCVRYKKKVEEVKKGRNDEKVKEKEEGCKDVDKKEGRSIEEKKVEMKDPVNIKKECVTDESSHDVLVEEAPPFSQEERTDVAMDEMDVWSFLGGSPPSDRTLVTHPVEDLDMIVLDDTSLI